MKWLRIGGQAEHQGYAIQSLYGIISLEHCNINFSQYTSLEEAEYYLVGSRMH